MNTNSLNIAYPVAAAREVLANACNDILLNLELAEIPSCGEMAFPYRRVQACTLPLFHHVQ
ncbi:hypothetical protein J3R75_002697 [Oligosphaera ethanolica]|uniref:Uncharacterized protein n=1 Tax=Oligosphaera ethanolica TaxID=760260 RepID=A0AAE4API8_9BACT|nr:hypothetical protein [Oligosphaera ethanolica]